MEEQKSPIDVKLDRYANSALAHNLPVRAERLPEAHDVWLCGDYEYSGLWLTAMDTMGTPDASAAVERVFSSVGAATLERNRRLSGENLEIKVLLPRNCLFIGYRG